MGLDMSVYKKNRKTNKTEELIYWRKVNQIHAWFVDMFMDGQDNCQIVYIGWGVLQDLKDTCKQILEDHSLAEELLPTRGGFFFGSTEYNEGYFEDLAETVAKIEAISLDDISDCDLFYNASW